LPCLSRLTRCSSHLSSKTMKHHDIAVPKAWSPLSVQANTTASSPESPGSVHHPSEPNLSWNVTSTAPNAPSPHARVVGAEEDHDRADAVDGRVGRQGRPAHRWRLGGQAAVLAVFPPLPRAPRHRSGSPRRVRSGSWMRSRVAGLSRHVGPALEDEPPVRRAATPHAAGLRQVELVHRPVGDVQEALDAALAVRVVGQQAASATARSTSGARTSAMACTRRGSACSS
jgi:hypothetical protein